jgi:hypothetical protein
VIRALVSRTGRRLAVKLASVLPEPRVIMDRDGKTPYLSRYYVFGGPRGQDSFDEHGDPLPTTIWRKLPFNIYLHKFHRGDDDEALHNHPWRWSFAIILAGGYVEQRRVGLRKMIWRHVLPGSINIIRGDDYHRVELIEKDAWSIFVAGPRVTSWNFWDASTGETVPWREFIDRKRAGLS